MLTVSAMDIYVGWWDRGRFLATSTSRLHLTVDAPVKMAFSSVSSLSTSTLMTVVVASDGSVTSCAAAAATNDDERALSNPESVCGCISCCAN